MGDTVLFENRWIQVIEKITKQGKKFSYVHHRWCNGQGIAVLPFHYQRCMIRIEKSPAYGDGLYLRAITGGNDVPLSPKEIVVKELDEEANLIVTTDQLIPLGVVYPTKGTDTIISLFAVELNMESNEQAEDGFAKWIDFSTAIFSSDPLLATMIARLQSFQLLNAEQKQSFLMMNQTLSLPIEELL